MVLPTASASNPMMTDTEYEKWSIMKYQRVWEAAGFELTLCKSVGVRAYNVTYDLIMMAETPPGSVPERLRTLVAKSGHGSAVVDCGRQGLLRTRGVESPATMR